MHTFLFWPSEKRNMCKCALRSFFRFDPDDQKTDVVYCTIGVDNRPESNLKKRYFSFPIVVLIHRFDMTRQRVVFCVNSDRFTYHGGPRFFQTQYCRIATVPLQSHLASILPSLLSDAREDRG